MFDLVVWLSSFAENYGLPGVFLLSLIGHATLFFPIPTYLIVYALGSQMDPFLLGLFAGVGAAIGELTSYFIGYGVETGVHLEKRRFSSQYNGAKKLFEKYGFWTIPLFAATPLPTDAIGLAAGVLKYPLSKFLAGCLLGKLAMHWVIAYGGYYSFTLVTVIFGEEGSAIGLAVFLLLVLALFLLWCKCGKDFQINVEKIA